MVGGGFVYRLEIPPQVSVMGIFLSGYVVGCPVDRRRYESRPGRG